MDNQQPSQKMCTKCFQEKDLEDFNFQIKAKNIRQSRCRLCTQEEKRERGKKNIKRVHEYNITYYQEHRESRLKYHHDYWLKNRDILTKKNQQKKLEYYQKNRKNIISRTVEYTREKRKTSRGRKQQQAHNAVQTALRNGSLSKGACTVCNSLVQVEAHHFDYEKPLDIVWLCRPCHNIVHRLEGPTTISQESRIQENPKRFPEKISEDIV